LAYIKPNYAARIIELIKKLGGKPFLTDANTLYSGRRHNALDHLQSAYENGGKLELHSTSKPKIVEKNCVGCGICVKNCAHDAIHLNEDKIAYIDYEKCVGCGQCIAVCQYNAAQVVWNESSEIMNKKIAEYTYAIVKDKPAFYINFIMNVSPDCDCWSNNDYPIVPDIGIAASFDPVALDMASVDLVKNAPVLPGSKIYKDHSHDFVGEDKFKFVHPNADWEAGLTSLKKTSCFFAGFHS